MKPIDHLRKHIDKHPKTMFTMVSSILLFGCLLGGTAFLWMIYSITDSIIFGMIIMFCITTFAAWCFSDED